MPSARYLVTGAAGFIGSHLAEALAARGATVRGADNLSNGSAANLEGFRERIEFMQGDLLDDALRARALEGVDTVFHQAAMGSVPRSIEDPVASHLNGPHLTLLLLESARRAGVRRFVYASSSSVYGDTPTLPKVETMRSDPLSPYAAGKAAGEAYVLAYARAFGMDTVSLRYFNVFGPRQRPDSPYSAVIPLFCRAVLEGRRPRVHGDGEQGRDFTYVEDAVRANLLAADCRAPLGGQAINIACGQRHSLNALLCGLERVSGTKTEADYGPARPGDIQDSLADISRAKEVLGYRPMVSFEEGLARTLGWFRERAAAASRPR